MTPIDFNHPHQSKSNTRKIIMARFVIFIVSAVAIFGAVAAFGPTRNPEGEMIVSIDPRVSIDPTAMMREAKNLPVDPAYPTF